MSSTVKNTRERILQAALRLMEERQGQGVRVEDIAQAAGISRQAVYLHFATRTDLLVATTHYLDEQLHLTERLQALRTARDGVESFEAFVAFWTNYIPDIHGLAKALLIQRNTDAAADAAWQDRMDQVYAGCLSAVRCLVRDQVLADGWTPEEAADFMWATLSVSTWEHLVQERGWPQERYTHQILWILRKALLK
jgi:AcrR family transcriptional regulator